MTIEREQMGANGVFLNMVSNLVSAMATIANKNLPESHMEKHGCWKFIPYSITSAYSLLTVAYEESLKSPLRPPKFLDCGCGIGNIVMLAALMGFDATGIEFSQKIFNVAEILREAGGYPRWSIIKGNILKYKDYSKYDVIYYYCPLVDNGLEEEFENRLADMMRVGAIVICCGCGNDMFANDKRFTGQLKNRHMY